VEIVVFAQAGRDDEMRGRRVEEETTNDSDFGRTLWEVDVWRCK